MSDEHDPVNKPSHYNSHPSGVECIQITEHYDFCVGNAIKYLWRAGLKGCDPQSGRSDERNRSEIQDLEKARWYVDRKIRKLKEARAREALAATESPEDASTLSRWEVIGRGLKKRGPGEE